MKLYSKISSTNRYNSDDSLSAEINIIPLVDVVLVLLIIFMIAAPLSLSTIQVNLPTTHNQKNLQQEPKLILSINKSGHYFLAKQRIEKKTLMEKLKAIYETRQSNSLYIQADKDLTYEKIILAMNTAKKAGIDKISLLTKPINEL